MDGDGKLRLVVIPWLGFSHMNPLLEFSKRLAQMGHHVSFLSLPRNIDRLAKAQNDLPSTLNLVKLTPPPTEGLPEEAQSSADVSLDQLHLIQKLLDGLDGQLRAFIDANQRPDWIINDFLNYKASAVAALLGIPSVFFAATSAAAQSFFGSPSALFSNGERLKSPQQMIARPPWVDFPTNVGYRYYEAVELRKFVMSHEKESDKPISHRLGVTFQACQTVAVRTCMELEAQWLGLLGKLYKKPIFPVGLLIPSMPTGHDEWEDRQWLDSHEHGSVVYVAFGTQAAFSKEQVHELALGLELSEMPFIWAYGGDLGLLPAGFEERTKGHGIIRTGFVLQARILSHPSVGCFFMQGEWDSAVEGIACGKPLVMLSMIHHQGPNASLLEEKKVGVRVPRDEQTGDFTRDDLAKCLKLVMVDDEGATIRSNATEMMKILHNEELDKKYMEDFVKYLIQRTRRRN